MYKFETIRPWLKNLPNKLTLGRVAAIPILLVLYPFDFMVINVLCALVFAAAAITDILDGFLARRYNSVTRLGTLIDPLADKMLVAAALVLLANAQILPAWMVGVLICRELGVSGLRLVAMESKVNIAVNSFGKSKTFFQVIAVFCLLIDKPLFNVPFHQVGMITIWIALILSMYSAYLYWLDFKKSIKIG